MHTPWGSPGGECAGLEQGTALGIPTLWDLDKQGPGRGLLCQKACRSKLCPARERRRGLRKVRGAFVETGGASPHTNFRIFNDY